MWNLDGAVYATPQVAGGCVIVATMGGSVYCLDPLHPGVVGWRTHLADPRTAGAATTFYGKTIGCLSKPAVDATGFRVYAVCASPTAWTVYSLDLATGAVLGSQAVAAWFPGAGCGGSDPVSGGNVQFSAAEQIQRPAMLLNGSTLIVGFGSNSDASPWHGWLLTYDISGTTPALSHVWLSTPNSCGGAIWQSGSPVAWDGANYYLATGNGTGDHSMQVVKLDAALNVVATWTPASEATLNANDIDVGSGAPLLDGAGHILIAFKDWRVRMLNAPDLSVVSDLPSNPSPPPLDGDSGTYGGLLVSSTYYVPTKPGPIYSYSAGGTLTPLVVGASSYASTMSLSVTIGVLWAITTSTDPYALTPWQPVTGTLRALDPTTLAEVWHADIGRMASFSGPGFSDQHVYAGNVDGVVRMFSHDPPVAQPFTGNSVSLLSWR